MPLVITLRAKLSGAVYCFRSCLWRAGGVCLCLCLFVCLWVCYHDNSKFGTLITLNELNERFKFGTDIEGGASLRRDPKTTLSGRGQGHVT